MPRAKQRHSNARAELKKRSLIKEIGLLAEAWIKHLREEHVFGDIPQAEFPMFPGEGQDMPPGFKYHSTAKQISNRIKDVCDFLGIRSERTGRHINITSTRFRRTIGTRAAEEGHGELVIADLLDHSDTQNVGVYVEATSTIVERIDKATALELAPIAQMFMGLIVDDEINAKRGDDRSSRVGKPDLGNVGTCGKYGFCGALAPIACYTCGNFQPWLDAPHELLLDELIEKREKHLKLSDDNRMASVNDATILAVADVVNRCRTMKRSMI
jgi:hypothetical protein